MAAGKMAGWSVGQSVSQSVCQLVGWEVRQSVAKSDSRSVLTTTLPRTFALMSPMIYFDILDPGKASFRKDHCFLPCSEPDASNGMTVSTVWSFPGFQ